jgi:hypothetical protein
LLGSGGADFLVQRVAQGHQLVDAGDDAVLFGKEEMVCKYCIGRALGLGSRRSPVIVSIFS